MLARKEKCDPRHEDGNRYESNERPEGVAELIGSLRFREPSEGERNDQSEQEHRLKMRHGSQPSVQERNQMLALSLAHDIQGVENRKNVQEASCGDEPRAIVPGSAGNIPSTVAKEACA